MKLRKLAAASAAAGLMAAASAASAAITVATSVEDDLHGATLAAHGQYMLDNFDDKDSVQTLYVGNIIEYPNEFQNPISTSAPPPWSGGIMIGGASVPVDNTNYASVQKLSSATYTMLGGSTLRSFSFYMGSPDTYNKVTFHVQGGPDEVFQGVDIWGGEPPGDGNRSNGFRVYYDFGGARVTGITFQSSENAFEFDGLAGAVPEPSTWAMMILGFGAAGGMIRSRRRTVAA